jgi:putative ABC transport system permease protein
MFLNYVKLSFRLMARNPFFTAINIVGLGVGFASFFALWDFSINELKADQHYKDFDRIVRIGWDWKWTDDSIKWDHAKVGFSKSDIPLRVKEDFPEVENYVRIHTQVFFGSIGGLIPHSSKIVMSGVGRSDEDRIFKEEHVVYADQNLFDFFSIPLIRGNASDVLTEAGSVVLSESQAVKYFEGKNPVGELLTLNDTITLKVTGVFRDLPHNTHLSFNTVISNVPYQQAWATAINGPTLNYVKLKKGTSFDDFEKKLKERRKDYVAALLRVLSNTDPDLYVQPLKEIVFSDYLADSDVAFRSKRLLITFAAVSVMLLAMAWINYINLWISRNKKREKELATRKINGAKGKDFIFQFLIESAMINLLALILAITLLQFARIPFNYLFGIQINEVWQLNAQSLMVFILVFVFSITLTGLYPALRASNNHPLSLFRRSPEGSGRIFSFGLVIVQYTSAITLILWSSIVYFELNHILDHEVGFDRDNVLAVEIPTEKNYEVRLEGLINRLASNPAIERVASSIYIHGDGYMQTNTRKAGSLMQIGFEWNGVNEDYLPLFGLKLVAGRNFIQGDRGDVVIISQVAAQRLGFEDPADAVGTKLEILKSEAQGDWLAVEVIGIMMEYRTTPFFETSAAASDLKNEFQSKGKMFTYKNSGFEVLPIERMAIKVKSGNLTESIASIEEEYQGLFPGTPFSWFFLEDRMNRVYASEKITRNQILLFVVLAIVIACLGFQGMITHKITTKTKEIGIRKILGAGTRQIGNVLLQPSFIQFGISIVIGVPIAWYVGDLYLQRFSERITLQWWHYALPVVILLLIMLATVSTLVWKALNSNPVQALKYE